MVHQITYFKDAFSAWEQWNLTDFDYKCEHLLAFKSAIEGQHSVVGKVVSYHLQQASSLLAETHQLVGPTGETNELYTAGRGVALVVCENNLEHTENALYSAFAMITCALIAGNSVVICSDNAELNQLVKHAVASANFPSNLVQVVAYDASSPLLDSDVRSVGYVGHSQVEHALNLQLAKRDGAIVGLVSETDLESPTLTHDPHLSLRFITERTRTINITAVGGNATLLELGSDSH
ncbi:1-pyrroline-5-carboxylate dehydrogenase [Vibrio campbellii]|uniref:1-pyrroline-5-carboxylate dehydrogenase n=1 Tax=Vibrio campbellii TaxID=680 RepID=UPI0009717815|nr:1-pyrroline-5-carboxylate dehydrogenase [Vibrio campbellii]APX07856.1 1-pyrroline-5-carboxylate dehydrogenase [Vibrio campbellii]ARR10002.1 1-pyrroline-5-carboxylate dehydrogenase [Vibrio campbellii]AYO11043.1 1-pyrroline-5-carboxylate dehydrogenase [Vibrio campbellii]NIY88301.1 1-pyrroline-5-carboxylate dehydrogenase [Vibrio campbellii]NVK68199.1 1-pyrroline-5-carboxylate dehydrogenase [Vibrio campbellii]